jgi:signal transduction histidine kinase
MRLQYKLIFAFGIIALLISLAGFISSNQINIVSSAYYKQQKEQLPAVSSLADLKGTLPLIALEPAQYIDKPDIEHIEGLAKAEEQMNTALTSYENIVGQEKVPTMKKDLAELFSLSREIIEFKDSGTNQEWIDERSIHLDEKIQGFDAKLELEKTRIAEELRASGEKLKDEILFTLQLTIVLAISAVVLAVTVCIFTSSSVSTPISRLKQVADQIGTGNFDVETRVTKSSDEIGELCIHLGKMKDALKNKEKMQNDFVSIASHELRTPIQPILGYAELASKGKINSADALQVILREGKRLQRLTNDILDVSRIESGRISYEMEKIAINELVSDVVNSLSASVSKDGVRLVTQLKAPKGLTAYADNIRMRQVLNNVIGNALKFTHKGEVNVHTHYLADKKMVEINITDSGQGIPLEILPNLFGKFVTSNLKIENKQGSGLGLFISKAIVEAHKGTIIAHNNDNGPGATFTIALPIHTVEKDLENSDRANLTHMTTHN